MQKTQRKLFHFADSSAATYNLTGGKEGASALAALQLFKPSPFNIITVYPLLEQFNNDVVRSALVMLSSSVREWFSFVKDRQLMLNTPQVITETGEQSMMVEFVNEFVEKAIPAPKELCFHKTTCQPRCLQRHCGVSGLSPPFATTL